MATKSRTVRQNSNRKIVGAIKEHLSNGVTLGGVKYAPAALAKMFQNGIDTADATDRAAKAWHLAVVTERENTQSLDGVQTALRNYMSATFGETSTEFADFGFKPRVVTAVDTETKAAAVVKREATRKARNTMGKRQKGKVKGAPVVPAAPAVPVVTTSAAPSAASVPASTSGALNGASTANGVTGSH